MSAIFRLLRLLRLPLLAFMLVYALVLALVYVSQRSMLCFSPSRSSIPFDFHITPTLDRSSAPLGGWLIKQSETDVVVFGRNAMSFDRLRHFLPNCTKRSILFMPYRGHEGNPGEPTEEHLASAGLDLVLFAKKKFNNVDVFGISLGTGVALSVAGQTSVDAVLLGTPYDRLDLVGHDHMPYVLPTLLMRDIFDNASAISHVSSPVFALRAQQDQVVWPSRTDALASAAQKANKTLSWLSLPGTHENAIGRRCYPGTSSRHETPKTEPCGSVLFCLVASWRRRDIV